MFKAYFDNSFFQKHFFILGKLAVIDLPLIKHVYKPT